MSTTSYDFQTAYGAERTTSLPSLARPGGRFISSLRQTLRLWHARATLRPQLARLNDHRLRDIGLTRAEADYEAAKPFWLA